MISTLEKAAMLALLGTCALAPSCHGTSRRTLTDTEGRSFVAECQRAQCRLERKSAPPVSADKPELALHSPGLVVAICDVAAGAQAEADSDCRALVCKSDADCPPSQGLDHGTCVNGLCIESSHALGVSDAVVLCLAGTGLGRSAPNQVDRYAMALNCGSPCRVPAPCRQP